MDYSKFRLRSFTRLDPYYILRCGSNFELPIKYSSHKLSDLDELFYCYDICAIPWNRNPSKNTRCTILRIDSTETPSGYARLKIDGEREKAAYYRRPSILANVERGGPSIKLVDKDSSTIREQYNLDRFDVNRDKVFAIYCPYWPVEAEEWSQRKRFHGWPNEKLIARITRGGCHFVSKLRTWSSCDDTEWRFSFSKAELLLIHSWTDFQKFVYHVSRVIKRRISETVGGDESKSLQTYYFKTLMFWACEELSEKLWKEISMSSCLGILFNRILRCLDNKFCPNYFIPESNIMSHLEGVGGFKKELQKLLEILANGNICLPITGKIEFDLSGSFEQRCLAMTSKLFPINEYLNGRFGEYLSECEWFLPGMKDLHAAIEAHLRLMSLDNVTLRKESTDYVECLENFKCSLIRNEDFESVSCANPELSFYENVNAILLRRHGRNSIPIYRRSLRTNFELDTFFRKFKNSMPSPLFFAVLANVANFHFTAMQSHKESLTECKRGFDFVEKWKQEIAAFDPTQFASRIPVLLCNSLSPIYDDHLQVILGFATLHRNMSYFESSNCSTGHETCLKLNPWEFLKYMCILCEQKLSLKPEKIERFFYLKTYLERSIMSQLVDNNDYSAAILFAALRQSRALTEPLSGRLIPRHYSLVP